MVEYWAVLGLCVTDCEFRSKLQSDTEATVKEYGFRLSRYEIGEIKRNMATSGVIEGLSLAHRHIWEHGEQRPDCWTGATPSSAYVHPYGRFEEDGSFVNLTSMTPEQVQESALHHVC